MILRAAKAVVPLAAASLIPLPAHADVLEIGTDGEARWIAGPTASRPLRHAAGPLAEVPGRSRARRRSRGEPAARYRARRAGRLCRQGPELAARFDLSPALIEARGLAGKPLARQRRLVRPARAGSPS